MRIYYFMLEENQNQFEKVETTSKNQFGILPKVYCTPEDIRDYCRYTIEARMGNKNMDEIMKEMERQLVDILGEEGLIELGLDTKEIAKSLQEITEELPKWIE